MWRGKKKFLPYRFTWHFSYTFLSLCICVIFLSILTYVTTTSHLKFCFTWSNDLCHTHILLPLFSSSFKYVFVLWYTISCSLRASLFFCHSLPLLFYHTHFQHVFSASCYSFFPLLTLTCMATDFFPFLSTRLILSAFSVDTLTCFCYRSDILLVYQCTRKIMWTQ